MKPGLVFFVESAKIKAFYFLLQQGIQISGPVGISIQDFIVSRLGIPPEDIDEKIQSVFLNGKVVDDLALAFITSGSLLALSGALPGLVGATMRRGGFYSSFRNSITLGSETVNRTRENGTITVKLFNILLPEFGPGLLGKGFEVRPSQLQEFLKHEGAVLEDGCLVRDEDGRETPCLKFSMPALKREDECLFIKVITR